MKRKSNCFVTILFLIYLALLVWIILFKLQFSISDLDKVRSINPVSYTHLDVYKRQSQQLMQQSLVNSEELWDGLTNIEQ